MQHILDTPVLDRVIRWPDRLCDRPNMLTSVHPCLVGHPSVGGAFFPNPVGSVAKKDPVTTRRIIQRLMS